MYAHPATQANVARLREFGYRIVEPESGLLASGMTGQGRLASLDRIVDATVDALSRLRRAVAAPRSRLGERRGERRFDRAASHGPRRPPRRRHRRRHRRADRPGPLRRQPLDGQDGRRRRPGSARPRRGRDAHSRQSLGRAARRAPTSLGPRPPPRCRQRCGRSRRPRAPASTSWSWPPPWPTSGRAVRAARKLGRAARADPRNGADAGPAGRARPSACAPASAGSGAPPAHPRRLRGRDRLAGAGRREAALQGSGPARRQRRHRARLGLRHGHEQGHDLLDRTHRPRSCRCCPSARSPSCCSIASWSASTAVASQNAPPEEAGR